MGENRTFCTSAEAGLSAADWHVQERPARKRASALAVLANLIWPLQAALLAHVLGGLVAGADISAV